MAKRKSILKNAKGRSRMRHSPAGPATRRPSGRGAPQEIPDLPALIHKLDMILATIGVARSALQHQAADVDLDVAAVLQRQVMNPLGDQIDRLRKLRPKSEP